MLKFLEGGFFVGFGIFDLLGDFIEFDVMELFLRNFDLM